MFVMLTPNADLNAVRAEMTAQGLWTEPLTGAEARGLRVLQHSQATSPQTLSAIPGVADVLAETGSHPRTDALRGSAPLGLKNRETPVLIAGPCAAESAAQVAETAAMVRESGGRFLRGGAYKPRTSPYSFQGHGKDALRWLADAAAANGLGLISEVDSEEAAEVVAEVADIIQVGSRTMQSFALLRAIGATGKPVLLKRGMAATVDEWLMAGEHLLAAGAAHVTFCERGIIGFDTSTRNLLDLGAVALLRHVHGLPVIVDPSHAAGRRDLILPLARAALAVGADGVMVETHPEPTRALSDGPQALHAEELRTLGQLFTQEKGNRHD